MRKMWLCVLLPIPVRTSLHLWLLLHSPWMQGWAWVPLYPDITGALSLCGTMFLAGPVASSAKQVCQDLGITEQKKENTTDSPAAACWHGTADAAPLLPRDFLHRCVLGKWYLLWMFGPEMVLQYCHCPAAPFSAYPNLGQFMNFIHYFRSHWWFRHLGATREISFFFWQEVMPCLQLLFAVVSKTGCCSTTCVAIAIDISRERTSFCGIAAIQCEPMLAGPYHRESTLPW